MHDVLIYRFSLLFPGYLAALAATIIWAGNFVVARAFAASIPPLQFNFWRWIIAFCAILPFALPKLRSDWAGIKNALGYLSLMGLLGVTMMNSFIYKAGQSTTSLNMALIMPATPAVILLLARLVYAERIGIRRLSGMLLALTGILILVTRGDPERLFRLEINSGDIWTLGCMLCFALYSLFMRQRPLNISVAGFNAAVFFLGLVYCLPFVAWEMAALPTPEFSWQLIGGLFYAGVGCSTIAFWLWTLGIDRIGPVAAGIVYYSLPLFAAVMAWLALGEEVTLFQLLGGAIIIAGIFIATSAIKK